jgi:hypothetical protein
VSDRHTRARPDQVASDDLPGESTLNYLSRDFVERLRFTEVGLYPARVETEFPTSTPQGQVARRTLGDIRAEVAASGGLENPIGQVQSVDLSPWSAESDTTEFYVAFMAEDPQDSG